MPLDSAFSILAVIEVVDKATRGMERIDASFDRFASTAARAAEMSRVAGEEIDASLLATASGADAVDLADARLSGAQAKVAATAKAQADAERAVIEAQAQAAAAEDGDTAAAAKLTAAFDALTTAQKRSALAAKEQAAAADHATAVGRAQVLSTAEGRAAADEAAASQTRLADRQAKAAAGGDMLSKGMKFAALGIAAVGYESVKAAGNFESMTEHLVTDAGESQQNIGMIRTGMLSLATTTGTTTDQMAAGMYHIESAGFHGKAALDVLKTAAEGAKVGGADLDTIGQALTGTMNAFGAAGGTSTQMMNAMIATVGAGDMKMQDLGSSLGNVAAVAASAKLSYGQLGGAIATMTAQNVTAQRATQDLAHTIGSLGNPTAVQAKEMTAMGIDSFSLAKNLGKNGLTGTFDILVQAIAAHTKGGAVMVNTLNASKQAAAQADQVLGQMPSTMRKVAQSWQAGTTTTAQFGKAIKALPPDQQKMYTAFEGLVKQSGGFAESLKKNTPMSQTFNAALAKMTGGTTSLNTILMLSGQHAGAFKDNVKTVSDAAHKSGTEVDNWDKIQGTFNQKMDRAKASVEAAGISIGTVLLPVVSKVAGAVADVVGPMATWIGHNQKIVGLLAAIVGPALAVVGIIKTIGMVTKLWAAAQVILDAAMEANPIGLIVALLAALVGGLIYAYTHFKTFRDIVNSVFSAAKTVVMAVVGALIATWHALVAAAEWVWHALAGAWNSVVGAALSVWHALEGAWNAVMSVTSTVWGAISGFFTKWWPLLLAIFLPFVAVVMAIWNHFHTQIIGTAMAVWNAVIGFFTGAWHLITGAAQTAWNLFKQYVLTPIQQVWTAMQPVIHTIEHFLSGVWSGILAGVAWVWNAIKVAIINPITSAWNQIVSIGGKISDAVSGAFHGALNAVAGVGSWFMKIGDDIINGIISGISGAAGGLFDKLKNVANDALNAAKSFLGIGSPSKEFADQVGQWIPHGIAAGVEKYAGVAHKAVRNLSAGLLGSGALSMTAGLSLSGTAGSGLAYSGGGGAGGGTVVNNVFDLRGSTVTGDRDMNLLVEKIGRQLATKGLPHGGVRIHA
jgi:TP901 family phage tail tape measure protein